MQPQNARGGQVRKPASRSGYDSVIYFLMNEHFESASD